jgi:uncharacterized membrane protein YfcA
MDTLTLGLLMGIVLGLLGGGGALIAIPTLIYLLDVPIHQAIALSLYLVCLGALPAVSLYGWTGQIAWVAALQLGVMGGVGALAGSSLAPLFPDLVLLYLLIAMMLISAFFMFRPVHPAKSLPEDEPVVRSNFWVLGITGFLIGVLTGLLGVGGGFFLVPVLLWLAKLPPRNAIATSLLIIAANALFGAVGHWSGIPWGLSGLKPLTMGMVLGSIVGFALNKRASQRMLKRGFGVLLVVLAVGMLVFPPGG